VDAINPDGTLDLSYPFDLAAQMGVDKERDVRPVLEPEQVEGEPTREREVIVKPLTDHERLVDFNPKP